MQHGGICVGSSAPSSATMNGHVVQISTAHSLAVSALQKFYGWLPRHRLRSNARDSTELAEGARYEFFRLWQPLHFVGAAAAGASRRKFDHAGKPSQIARWPSSKAHPFCQARCWWWCLWRWGFALAYGRTSTLWIRAEVWLMQSSAPCWKRRSVRLPQTLHSSLRGLSETMSRLALTRNPERKSPSQRGRSDGRDGLTFRAGGCPNRTLATTN